MRHGSGVLVAVAALVASLMLSLPSLAEEGPGEHWSYTGATGPAKWGTLMPGRTR